MKLRINVPLMLATLYALAAVAVLVGLAGCSASQKANGQKIVALTTQPTQRVLDTSVAVAAATAPGSTAGDIATLIAAGAGILLVLEKGVSRIIDALPNAGSSSVSNSVSLPATASGGPSPAGSLPRAA